MARSASSLTRLLVNLPGHRQHIRQVSLNHLPHEKKFIGSIPLYKLTWAKSHKSKGLGFYSPFLAINHASLQVCIILFCVLTLSSFLVQQQYGSFSKMSSHKLIETVGSVFKKKSQCRCSGDSGASLILLDPFPKNEVMFSSGGSFIFVYSLWYSTEVGQVVLV